jgi:ribosomal protein S18 acetylase RimI-like enzyme
MEIRAAKITDLDRLIDLDGTIDSSQYLHVERSGDGLTSQFRLEARPLRARLVDPNGVGDELRFAIKGVIAGIDEGLALAGEHDDMLVALAVARLDQSNRTLDLIDLRVDFEFRRQGIGSAMLFALIQEARNRGLRAVRATTQVNNLAANSFLSKAGLELAGLDTHFRSNHDLVKEAVTLFWYAVLE